MSNEVQPILQIDRTKDPNTGRNISILTPLDSVGLGEAISNMKKSLDPKDHDELNQALNRKMGSFMERAYSVGFADTIRPLNEALTQAKNGEMKALARTLGMENLLLTGKLQQKASIELTGTSIPTLASAPPAMVSTAGNNTPKVESTARGTNLVSTGKGAIGAANDIDRKIAAAGG